MAEMKFPMISRIIAETKKSAKIRLIAGVKSNARDQGP